MVDVTEKPVVLRRAETSGKIFLSKKTIKAVRAGRVKKGDPVSVAEVAGMNAA